MAEWFFSSSPVPVCPENRLRWDLSPKQIHKVSEDFISKMKVMYDAAGTRDLDSVTASNLVKDQSDAAGEYMLLHNLLDFNCHVSPSQKVRTASTRAQQKLCLAFEGFDKTKILLDNMVPKDNTLTVLTNVAKQLLVWILMKLDILISGQKRHTETQLDSMLCLPKDKQDEIKNISIQLLQPCEKQSWATLKKTVKLYARRSALLGFKTHADCVLNTNMANSAEKVSTFLDELAHKLKPLGDKERAILLKLKKEHCQKRRLPFNGKLNERELQIYKAQVTKKEYGVDHDRLKEYFPLEVVTQGLLDIFQDLLGLSFSLVDGASVWHPDVTLYCVTDQSSQQTVGQFYLDLFIRKGKSTRENDGECFPLQPGCLRSDGTRQIPIVAIVTNFSKSKSTPCLLYHKEVLAYFHEFGHAMHYLCAQVDYAVWNSFKVEPDFLETPSEMCEIWAWEKEPLQRVSKHYKTGAPIPDDLLDKLIKSRLANTGIDCLQEIINAKLDNALHTRTALDPGKEYARLRKEILGVHAPQRTNISDMCGEPLDQSPANHYRYLWSKVLAMDMFYSRFKQEGIMNPKVGLDYRECILNPGCSKDAEEMLKNFLGREPNHEAFLLSKGLTTLETRKRKLEESQERGKRKKLDLCRKEAQVSTSSGRVTL